MRAGASMPDKDHLQTSKIDDCLSVIQRLKELLLSHDQVSGVSEVVMDVRRHLRGFPAIKGQIPDFVLGCRDAGDIDAFKNEHYPESFAWNNHIRSSLNLLADRLEEDTLDFERFEILDTIGNGGFGHVYRVQHNLVGLEFAIKVLAPFGGTDEESHRRRFFQEAEMLYKLRHESIIRIFEVGLVGRRPYIAMDYIAGKDLNKVLLESGRVSASTAWDIIQSVAHGLQHAHDNGIVHRDLKPSNILTGRPREIRIIDFGLGIYIEQALEDRITTTGRQIAGGPYTAPELRIDPKLKDPLSDVFSLGAVWFELVSGGSPGGSNLGATLRDVEGLPLRHQDAILKCLENANDRFQSCNDVLEYITSEDGFDEFDEEGEIE